MGTFLSTVSWPFPFWGTLMLGIMSGVFGILSFAKTYPPRVTFVGNGLLFLAWSVLIAYIGMKQEACPIHGTGQIFVFLSWALMCFYLVAGTAYRLSFLGGITGIAVLVFACLACTFGIDAGQPWEKITVDFHVALAMLAYAAFTLSAVASLAFFVQNRHLKEHTFDGSYRKLPKLNLLSSASPKLDLWGIGLLTLSIAFSFADYSLVTPVKLIAGTVTWAGYASLLIVAKGRGMPPRLFAVLNVAMCVVALTVIFASR